MKLLIDPMLSEDLVFMLQEQYPGTVHVTPVLGKSARDPQIWRYARENGFTILTKDKDFVKLADDNGQPPKLIKLDTGNSPTQAVVEALERHRQELREFETDGRSFIRID
jgi:predicted nuclease of predicted toxin-antitoxin system